MHLQELLRIEGVTGAQNAEFWSAWNAFVRRFGTSPMHLGGFVEFNMTHPASGWTPRLVVMRTGRRIVGAKLLKTKGVFGARVATDLYPVVYGTEFIVDPEYRRAFVQGTLRFLLGDLRCQFLDLTLPGESPNLPVLKEASLSMRLRMVSAPLKDFQVEHSVLQIASTWDEFEKRRGGNFARHFRKIEHKLDAAGDWRIERLRLDGPGPVSGVVEVEKNSWKEGWRRERGIVGGDPTLPQFFGYRDSTAQDGDIPRLWLLVLNDVPIAYAIGAQLNGVAYLCKTSYDLRFANLYPGDLIQNAAIRDLFESKAVSSIDLLTPLSYHLRWTGYRPRRERMMISRTFPVLTSLVTTLSGSTQVRRVYKRIARPAQPAPREGASTP